MLYLLSPEGILIAAAVIPAIALLVMVYRQDRIEREPLPLLLSLVAFVTALSQSLTFFFAAESLS